MGIRQCTQGRALAPCGSRIQNTTTVDAEDSLQGFLCHRHQCQLAHEVFLQVRPEGLVSQAVHHGADGPGQNVDDDVARKQCVRQTIGEPVVQKRFQQWVCVHQHAQQQLEAVEQDGVSGLLCIRAGGPGGEQDAEVRVDQGQPHDDQQQHVVGVPLEDDARAAEHGLPQTEVVGAEERHGLCGQGHKQVREDGERTGGPDQPYEEVGSPHGADAGMVQRATHRHVALQGHAEEVERCVFGGEQSQQDDEAAQGDVDAVEGVAEQEEEDGEGQLDSVIDDHVDEEDVAGIGVEDLSPHSKQKGIGYRYIAWQVYSQRLCKDETDIGEGVLGHDKRNPTVCQIQKMMAAAKGSVAIKI